eukprot:scaffold534110_cov20-Prasinocladus_malaysianus.AAC.1
MRSTDDACALICCTRTRSATGYHWILDSAVLVRGLYRRTRNSLVLVQAWYNLMSRAPWPFYISTLVATKHHRFALALGGISADAFHV